MPGSCQHHWVIEPAEGSTSQGHCKKCHEVRDFKNSVPDYGSTGLSTLQFARDHRQDGGDFFPQGDR